jgi:hypothetical protein
MQCIERMSGGFQLRSAAGEMGEQDFSALTRSGVEHMLPAGAERLVVCCVLDMA